MTSDERRVTNEEGDAVRRARVTKYWTTYHRLQELWRQGEVLSLERWGRRDGAEPAAEQEMRQLCQVLEAVLVGFE